MGVADHRKRRHGIAMGEFDEMFLVIAPDAQLQFLGQGIDDRNADAMQAARHLVGVLVEFAAGMKLGHDDFGRRNSLALMDVDGNAAAIVAHGHRAIGIQDHLNRSGVSGQRLVDGVIDHLIDHVMQAGPIIGVADIHAGPLAHGIKAFQNPDRFRAILDRNGRLLIGDGLPGRFGHLNPSRNWSNQPRATRRRLAFFVP